MVQEPRDEKSGKVAYMVSSKSMVSTYYDDDVRENLLLNHRVFFGGDKDDEDMEGVEQQDVEMEEEEDVKKDEFECYLDAFDSHHGCTHTTCGQYIKLASSS